MSLPTEPYSRIERYLAKLAGQDVDIPDKPITRIECYLDYLVNNGGGALASNAGAHNSIFRGKSLGTSVTDAQIEAIDAGTFDDIFVGDYWTIGEVKYRVAGIDVFLGVGDSEFTKHHLVIVPDTSLGIAKYNAEDTMEGGYGGSLLRATIYTSIVPVINTAFGEDRVLVRRAYLTSSMSGNVPAGLTWYDSTVEVMNESQIIGRGASGTQNQNGNNVGSQFSQFPLFSLNPALVCCRVWCWLQDIKTNTTASAISDTGVASFFTAHSTLGVRPYFCLGKGT